MKTRVFSTMLAMMMVLASCKKDRDKGEPSGPTSITTLELEYKATPGISGMDYTFRVKFDQIGEVAEYGIVFVPFIRDKADKVPTFGGFTSVPVKFTEKAGPVGTVHKQEQSFRFSYFNDANYRAYAVLKDGTVVYGETLHIGFS